MYHSKEIFSFLIIFLLAQKQMSDNIVNAETHNSMHGLKNYNNQGKPVLCDQCLSIMVACLSGNSMCENIICSNKACESCFKIKCSKSNIEHLQNQNVNLQSEKSFESDKSSFSKGNMLENVSNKQVVSIEPHRPAAETQHSYDESKELGSSVHNSSERLHFMTGSATNGKQNQNLAKFYYEDQPFVRYTFYVLFTIVGFILIGITVHSLLLGIDPMIISTYTRKGSNTNGSPSVNNGHKNCKPMRAIRSKNDKPPSYEQCTHVPLGTDEFQLQTKSV